MRTVRIKLYKYNELNPKAQAKVLDTFRSINVDFGDWWEATYDDAKQIGLELGDFEFDSASFIRNLKGKFEYTGEKTAGLILENHGELCDTYNTAAQFIKDLTTIDVEQDIHGEQLQELEETFLNDLLIDYKNILQNEYEALHTDEAVIDTITANEYEFTADGSPAGSIAAKASK